MATVEHCLVCFEALDAALHKTKPLSLDELRASWAVYKSSTASPAVFSPKDPALQRVAATTAAATAAASAVDSDSASASSSSTVSLGASTPATSASSLTPAPVTSAPLFVTWNTINDPAASSSSSSSSSSSVSLRGCIGTFESQPLADGLPEYALISAVQDTRFAPISRRELPSLQVAVTLLTDFEEAADARDWDVGVHGLRISFHDKGRRYGATYLPDIASEQGWTRDETLFSLVRKAGWTGSRARWAELALKVTRYQGKKRSMNYGEYKKWKDWAAKQA